MEETLQDLMPLFKAVKTANKKFDALPSPLDAEVGRTISAEEREDYRDEIHRIWHIATVRQTPANVVDYLRLHEKRLVRLLETHMLKEADLPEMYDLKKLTPKDIDILVNHGITILAGSLERARTISYIAPHIPAAKAVQGVDPSEHTL